MISKLLSYSGVMAVIIYIAAVVIGGAIRPEYSHIRNFISELITAGAPNKGFLNPLFALYNILTGTFAIGLLTFVSAKSNNTGSNIGKIGAYILIAEAVFGLATLFFPQDLRGTPGTTTGTMHIILAGLSSLTTMGALFCLFFWFKNTAGLSGFGIYSLISLIIIFVFGGLTAFLTGTNSLIVGLMERITIGGFLQWMLVIGIAVGKLI